jgi:hypothetical protein
MSLSTDGDQANATPLPDIKLISMFVSDRRSAETVEIARLKKPKEQAEIASAAPTLPQ